jgi:hypothetical protein
MGRIMSHVTVSNPLHAECSMSLNALVDTGASAMFLPESYQVKLGEMEELEPSFCTFADGSRKLTRRFGPVRIQLDGFPKIYNEVMFLPADEKGNDVEPLIGYIVLGQSRAGVDMVGHRLFKVDSYDLKGVYHRNHLQNTSEQTSV